MASLSGGGRKAGSSRLSQLVTDTHSASKPRRVQEVTRKTRDASKERQHSQIINSEEEEEEEEIGDSSEDEEELMRNATPYEEEDVERVLSHKVLFEAQALGNFEAEEGEDLSFKEREILTILESSRDDGWLLAENALGERGLVPGNYVRHLTPTEKPSRAPTPADSSLTPRRGRDLWSKLHQTVKQTSLADVLGALGAIPSGFRDSTMAKLLASSTAYLTSTWVMPRPSSTGMGFKDLKWNHSGDHLQPTPAKISHEVSLVLAKMIPLPGKGIKVLSRHIRLAIFNKNDILSNIHTVRAVWTPQEEKTWKFASKSQTAMNSLYHRVCTIRMDSNDTNLELLFELGITFYREKTGEKGEISCGWSSLPLYDHTGNPTSSKTYELKVHGGTPFESGVDIAASNIKVSGIGLLPSLLRARQTPRLYVKLVSPSSSQKKVVHGLLPPTLITASTYIRAIGCFRHLVGVASLRGRLGLPLQNSLIKPSFNVFLEAIDQPDVMDFILVLLQERLKIAKRGSKNLGYITEQVECILLQYIYPLFNSISFSQPVWADETVEKERLQFMEKFSKRTDLSTLLASDTRQKVLSINEQIFSFYPY